MFYIMILVLLVLDQLSKNYIRAYFEVGETLPVLNGIFHISYVQNTGASFGMFSEHTHILTGFTLIVLFALFLYAVYFIRKVKKGEYKLDRKFYILNLSALTLIISGGIGNAIDRIVRGFVTDMFDFRIWPVFNVADIYICIGCVLFFYCVLVGEKSEREDGNE